MATPQNNPDKVTYFAETDYRSKRIKFGIRDEDRARHMYVIGKTGMGKSTLLENLAIQDIQNGEGVCFIDPHGGTAETLLSYVPESRIKDVIYFAPFDQEFPVGLNVMEDLGRDKRPLVVSGLMGAFKKVWVDAWSARMEYILNNAMLALMETPGSTLLGVNRMFADKDYRSMIVANITDPSVRAFWVDEYAKYSDKFATEATAAIQNKVGQFAANPLIRNMVGQPKSTFDIRRVMDERKIFIVNLSKGRMGEGNANLVGSMLITKIYLAAMSRADVGPEAVKSLPSFYLYVDEFQSFANESFADILSEARKYKLALTIAHQYIEQMSDEVRAAVFGNVGTMISFRVGSYDAEVLEKEFAPVFLAEDMVNLGFAQVYMKLMIRGIGSPPFSATTLNRPKEPARNFAQAVIDASHAQFARPRVEVEEEIKKWHEPVPPPPRDPNAPEIPATKKFAPGMRPLREGAALPPRGASAAYTPSGFSREQISLPQTPLPEQPMPRQGSYITPPQVLPPPAYTQVPETAAIAPVVSAPITQPNSGALSLEHPAPAVISHPSLPEIQTSPRPQQSETVQNVTPPIVSRRVPQKFPPSVSRPPSPVTPSPTHRPFQEGFAKIANSAIEAAPSATPRPPLASLSSLKNNPKSNKGPSSENLSSLRAALDAAMKTQVPPEEKKEFAPKTAPHVLPMAIPTTQSAHASSETPMPKQKSSLLEDVPVAQSSNEVPEEVLKKLLADG